PGAMGAVAKPMTWPYLCTASPLATARSATLCPDGTSRATRISPYGECKRRPGGSGTRATATSSSGCRCTATSARSAVRVVVVGVTFTRPDVVDVIDYSPSPLLLQAALRPQGCRAGIDTWCCVSC